MQSSYLLLGALVPFFVLDIWYTGIFVLWTMKVSIITYLIVFGVLPLIFHYSYTIQRKILFLNFVYWPPSVDFTKPESVGLEGARNFYLTTDENVKIGTWQILPRSLVNGTEDWSNEKYEEALSNAVRPVFLYMHGNSGNRASRHRLELYKLFQQLDYHLVCFDYRSYGDSDPADLSEAGVVADSKFVLQWLMKKVNGTAPIFVWGHSLGTGVSSHALAQLSIEGIQPNGLFLESPFNNIADELSEHPFAQIFKHLPWFHWIIVQPFYGNYLRFESDKHVENIKCPIMILHAEDDNVVPFSLGEKTIDLSGNAVLPIIPQFARVFCPKSRPFTRNFGLYAATLKFRVNETDKVQMTRISSSLGLGHKWICRYHELPMIIEKFVAQSQKIR